jgi:hypothetical protein
VIGNQVGVGGRGWGCGWGYLSTVYFCLRCRCLAATSTVRAWVALLSIMSTNRGPIFISAISLPVAIFASAMSSVFCLRGPPSCGRSRRMWLPFSAVALRHRVCPEAKRDVNVYSRLPVCGLCAVTIGCGPCDLVMYLEKFVFCLSSHRTLCVRPQLPPAHRRT